VRPPLPAGVFVYPALVEQKHLPDWWGAANRFDITLCREFGEDVVEVMRIVQQWFKAAPHVIQAA